MISIVRAVCRVFLTVSKECQRFFPGLPELWEHLLVKRNASVFVADRAPPHTSSSREGGGLFDRSVVEEDLQGLLGGFLSASVLCYCASGSTDGADITAASARGSAATGRGRCAAVVSAWRHGWHRRVARASLQSAHPRRDVCHVRGQPTAKE